MIKKMPQEMIDMMSAEFKDDLEEYKKEYGRTFLNLNIETQLAFAEYRRVTADRIEPEDFLGYKYCGYYDGIKNDFAWDLAGELYADGSGRTKEEYVNEEYGSLEDMASALFAQEYNMSSYGFVYR